MKCGGSLFTKSLSDFLKEILNLGVAMWNVLLYGRPSLLLLVILYQCRRCHLLYSEALMCDNVCWHEQCSVWTAAGTSNNLFQALFSRVLKYAVAFSRYEAFHQHSSTAHLCNLFHVACPTCIKETPPSQILLVLPVFFKHDGAVLNVRVLEIIKWIPSLNWKYWFLDLFN